MTKSKRKSVASQYPGFDSLQKLFGVKSYGRRQFARDVKKLAKAGLYTPKSEDVTDYAIRQIRKFKDVLTGHAAALPVAKHEIPAFKKTGERIAKGKLIVPKPKGSVARRSKPIGGKPSYHIYQTSTAKAAGFSELSIAVAFTDLESWLPAAQKYAKKNFTVGEGQSFAFVFFGNRSHQIALDTNLLFRLFARYQSVQKAMYGTRSDQLDIYRNFKIVRVDTRIRSEWRGQADIEKEQRRKARNAERNRLSRENHKKYAEKQKRENPREYEHQQWREQNLRQARNARYYAKKKALKGK